MTELMLPCLQYINFLLISDTAYLYYFYGAHPPNHNSSCGDRLIYMLRACAKRREKLFQKGKQINLLDQCKDKQTTLPLSTYYFCQAVVFSTLSRCPLEWPCVIIMCCFLRVKCTLCVYWAGRWNSLRLLYVYLLIVFSWCVGYPRQRSGNKFTNKVHRLLRLLRVMSHDVTWVHSYCMLNGR